MATDNFQCLLCPNTFGSANAATEHLAEQHHISSSDLRVKRVEDAPPPTAGTAAIPMFRWELPNGRQVMQTSHEVNPRDVLEVEEEG